MTKIKLLKNIFGKNKKISASDIVLTDKNNMHLILEQFLNNFSGCKIEKTTNGFVIKFPNGFMVQGKETFAGPTNATQNNSIWTGQVDLGNWDIPFTTFLYASASISRISGARNYWLGGYTQNNNPSATYCGKIIINETWNGLSNGVGILSIGYGYWK